MSVEEHLNRIVAKCRELLAIAGKRTPGPIIDNVNFCAHSRMDADFIASCAGPAEAGWRATIAACEFIQAYRKVAFGWDGDCGANRLVDAIEDQLTAAWPEELL